MAAVPYWRLSGFYFFYFCTLGGLLPYWGLYLQSKGFMPEQIGELMAWLMGTKIIAPNIWGWIADHSGRSMRLIRLASLAAAVIFFGYFWSSDYVWLAVVTVGFSFFWNAALPQFEAATLAHLHKDIHRYSQIRLWGSIGFIATVIGFGLILDLIDITVLPVLIAALLVAIWLISITIPEVSQRPQPQEALGLWPILRQPEVIAFFLALMLVQLAHAPYYVFFSIYLEQHQYSATDIGWLWALAVSAEVVLFLYMHRLLRRFSLRTILLTSILLGVVRWSVIAVGVENGYWLIFAQLLHAATFGSSHVAAIQLVHRYFSGRQQGRGQAIYSSTSFGLGGMLGSLFSGNFWSSHGPVVVYSVAALASLLAFLIAWCWVGRGEREALVYYPSKSK